MGALGCGYGMQGVHGLCKEFLSVQGCGPISGCVNRIPACVRLSVFRVGSICILFGLCVCQECVSGDNDAGPEAGVEEGASGRRLQAQVSIALTVWP